jgi:hypothetical protein
MRAPYPTHFILLDYLLKNTGCEVHHYAVFSIIHLHSLLGPNILLNSLFSKTLSLCSSLKVIDQVSHPYSTTGKISFVYFNL